MSEVSGKNYDCVTAKDNATDSSSARSFAESSANTYQFSTALSSSLSSSSQPVCDGTLTPCIGRGRKLLESLGRGSTPPVPGGLFLNSVFHFVSCRVGTIYIGDVYR